MTENFKELISYSNLAHRFRLSFYEIKWNSVKSYKIEKTTIIL